MQLQRKEKRKEFSFSDDPTLSVSSTPPAAHDADLLQPPGPGGEPRLGPVGQQLRLHGHPAHQPSRPRDQRQRPRPLPRGPALLRLPLVPAREVPQQVSGPAAAAASSSLAVGLYVYAHAIVCSSAPQVLCCVCRKNWYLPAPEVSPSSPVEFSLLSKEETSWGTVKMTFNVKGQDHDANPTLFICCPRTCNRCLSSEGGRPFS